jgi:hypothetical protein
VFGTVYQSYLLQRCSIFGVVSNLLFKHRFRVSYNTFFGDLTFSKGSDVVYIVLVYIPLPA